MHYETVSRIGAKYYWLFFLPFFMLFAACEPGNDEAKPLSGGYTYRWESKNDVYISHNRKSENVIPCNVIDYAYNDDFVIAAQKTEVNCFAKNFQRAMQQNYDINYWIATTNNDQLVGPLSFEEYEMKRTELEVPNELSLEVE